MTFLIRRGTSLGASEEASDSRRETITWSLVASQYGLPSVRGVEGRGTIRWIPLAARVFYQQLEGGRWVTRKIAVLDAAGRASMTVPDSRSGSRFIVPGTQPRMLPDGFYAAGREPAVF